MRKNIGLDIGPNSIGWASINTEIGEDGKEHYSGIEAVGSRIIPMDAAILGDFDKGNTISQTATRTGFRGIRRLYERYYIRRQRINRILDILGFLPPHYAEKLDRYGAFINKEEPKIAWHKNELGKYEFLFKQSYEEMLRDFQSSQPILLSNGKKIPYDWTVYYLREKALTKPVSKEELSWILLNFNHKRGYYQLRGEDEDDDSSRLIEYYSLKVTSIDDTGEKKGKDTWYDVHLENGMVYHRVSGHPLDWVGKTKEFIVTTELNDDGTPKKDKDGSIRRSFRQPKENDWTLRKKRTEFDLEQSGKTVGSFIYNALLNNPDQKILGSYVQVIGRKYYKSELKQILETQKLFHPELADRTLFDESISALYPSNEEHRKIISSKDFTYLFLEDVIYYQRPLKSKVSLIDDCPFESRYDKDGNIHTVKCIAKSHPLYQEFRLWQFISNIKILQIEKEVNGKLISNYDITSSFLKNDDDYTSLFDWLNDRKEIDQKAFLKYPGFGLKKKASEYRWNYVEDKSYPCNATRALMLDKIKNAGLPASFLNEENQTALWHILYSVNEKEKCDKALATFARKKHLSDTFVASFSKFPPLKREYGAYSSKAINKLLPLMRMGKYWNEECINNDTRKRIEKILTGEFDQTISNRVREKAIHLTSVSDFKGLPLWLASYVVYNRHSEAKDIVKWSSPSDIDTYLHNFKQYSLRNPIVEQVVTETLRTVRDIWKQYGKIDEIHVELGRSLKQPADKRARDTIKNLSNENTNLRIKALLLEFTDSEFGIENVRPYSPSQQDLLKIYEDGAFGSVNEIPDDINNIISKFNQSDASKRPTKADILRYKLWLEQKYRSPYTGAAIPLGKLFTPAYEIEHIIPQSRYFDDSFSNKVICESEVNKLKDNDLGYEFIKKHHGEVVSLNYGKTVEILSVEEYEKLVCEYYSHNDSQRKKRNLLLDDIPDEFIQRQMNDTRYITKVIIGLLSNVVREKDEEESTSKNVISCTGQITDRLKKEWGMQDVWNAIVLPRFKRMNEITGTTDFTSEANGHVIPAMPLQYQKGFNKKRIDHRHHAMDAIVIACTTRDHVNLLNNEAALSKNKANRYQLSHKLRKYETVCINGEFRDVPVGFLKPWETFTDDSLTALKSIVVSFKHNQRIINKTVNHYYHYKDGEKKLDTQHKGDCWAIRKSMHKASYFGLVNLRLIKEIQLSQAVKDPQSIVDKELKDKIIELLAKGGNLQTIRQYFEDNKEAWSDLNSSKIKYYYFTNDTNYRFYAKRQPIDTSFSKDKIIDSVTDTGAQAILLRHLAENDNDPKIAFSPDGLDRMNENIKLLNNGKEHKPILKVRVYENAEKFPVGQTGNKSTKYVEADKGTNLFFGIYQSIQYDKETGEAINKRSFSSIPLNVAIQREKEGLSPVPAVNENGESLLFSLSPNDLVYLPNKGNNNTNFNFPNIDATRIYKMVSCSGHQCYFIPHSVASSIIDKQEFGPLNKMERALTGEMIKEICLPISIDRLGNITIMSITEHD
jgi:CRISPR-associated endonuclease Csn1